MGHEPVLAPCLTITRRKVSLPASPAAIIITSAQAVTALPALYKNIPVFCVGDATAERVREAGFTAATSASGDARDLFRLITARNIQGAHLLAVGERHGMALARQLREAGITVVRRVVYAAKPVLALPAPVIAAMAAGQVNAALFYSAESARAFARLKPPCTGMIQACVLSRSVAEGLHGLPWAGIHIAFAPTEADLLGLLP
jgi:uroporphyrinogen-III synthase